jgi:DHA2 family multidrug resistance protein
MPGVAPAARLPITVSVMMASTMTAIDTTIANVALPHMQGGVSASQEQISWVLTSYIVASAITIPLTGWLSGRMGRKNLLLISIVGFTIASMLCGMAMTVPQIVLFRALQGVFGAPLGPLSQAVLLDSYPPEEHGQAMAVWGMGTVLGPMAGPLLGGYLTDQFSWRWVFFINAPIGLLALIGCWVFIKDIGDDRRQPFDFLGFSAIVGFIASLQLMLDRGPSVDWFNAAETWVYLLIAVISLWVFVIHMLTATHPFFDRRLLSNFNFTAATLFGFMTGFLLMGSFAMLPPLTQGLLGYSAYESGVISIPRGFGSVISMFIVGQLVARYDPRYALAAGLALLAWSAWLMAHFDLSMGMEPLIISGIGQGLGMGMVFVPSNTLAFATVPLHLRAEAAAFNSIVRSMGGSIGISIMQALSVANTQVMHQSLADQVNPADPRVSAAMSPSFDLSGVAGLSALNQEITRQAAMVAYLNDFRLMIVIVLFCAPMLFFLRPARPRPERTSNAFGE